MSKKKKESNNLFPIFLKLESLHTLVVGGGNVGLEKLNAILTNSPAADITVVATTISKKIKKLAEKYPSVSLKEKNFEANDIDQKDLVIVAVNDKTISQFVQSVAKQKKILVNVADKPDLCDFYLGSIVKKGNLKIAISTNGKSPTIAKRIKENLDDVLPKKINKVLDNMETIRKKMNGNFALKVKKLNKITKQLAVNDKK